MDMYGHVHIDIVPYFPNDQLDRVPFKFIQFYYYSFHKRSLGLTLAVEPGPFRKGYAFVELGVALRILL